MPAFLIPVVAAVAAAVAATGANHALGAHERNKIKKNAKKMQERLKYRKPISQSEAKDMYKNWEKVKDKGLIKSHMGLKDLPSNKKDFFNDIKKYNKKAEKHNLKAEDLKQFGGAPGYGGKGFSLKDQLKFQEAQLPIQKKAAQQQIEIAKKYGKPQKFAEEKLLKPALYNKKQNKLLDQLAKQGLDVRESLQLDKSKKFKNAENATQELLNNPGVTNPRDYQEFGVASNTLQDLINNQGISDVRQDPGYRQAHQGYSELLDQSPEAYNRFSAQEKRRYNSEVIPNILGRFGHGGQQSSALNAALANSGADLQERLAVYRGELQREGRKGLMEAANAPYQGEVARANIKGGAANQLFGASGINTEAEKARANILGGAAGQAAGFAQQKVLNRQQEIANGQNAQQLALGAKPFENLYQPAQYYNVTGLGATQAQPMYGGGQQQQQQKPYQPGWGAQIGGAAAQGLGQGLGQGLANAGAQAATSWFNPATPAAAPKNTPIFQNNQMGT